MAIDMLMPPEASPEVIAEMKKAFGFDQPLYVQYLLWLGRALRGDFGLSVFNAPPIPVVRKPLARVNSPRGSPAAVPVPLPTNRSMHHRAESDA